MAPVSHFDIFATAAAAAGQKVPADRPIDGVNLLPFIKGEAPGRPHDALFWRTDTYLSVRAGDWKLQVAEQPRKDWLFNLATDPTEQTNLATAEPERVAALKAQLLEWNKGQRKPMWPSLGAGPIAIDHSLRQPTKANDEYVYYAN
jgi:arylsulfatase A-like enzyme